MLEAIFSGIELIHKKGGMKIMLDFGNGRVHKVIAKPAIHFIIGDYNFIINILQKNPQ